jgi:hypothetical protein
MSRPKWEPKEWLQTAMKMQELHPFVPVQLEPGYAKAILTYINGLEELAEELKKQLGGFR